MEENQDKPLCELEGEDFIARSEKIVKSYYELIKEIGIADLWKRSFNQYYSGYYNRGVIGKSIGVHADKQDRGGRDGLFELQANHYKNLLSHLSTLITKEPPLIDAVAVKDETKSNNEAIKIGKILEYYQKKKDIDSVITQSIQYELLFGMSYLVAEWVEDTRKPLMPNYKTKEAMLFTGDAHFRTKDVFNVIKDIKDEDPDWYIIRDKVEVYKLKKKYPDLVEKKVSFSTMITEYDDIGFCQSESKNDLVKRIDVFTLIQFPNVEYPKGKKVKFIKGAILEEVEDLKGSDVIVVANDKIPGTSIGNTTAFDILQLQLVVDNLFSAEVTNHAFYGLNSIMVPKALEIEGKKIGNAANIFEVETADGNLMPKTLNMLEDHPSTLKYIELSVKWMETLSGINPVMRGEAKPTQSGQALALITSMGHQFASGMTKSFRKNYKYFGEILLKLLKENMIAPRTITVSGKGADRTDITFSQNDIADEHDIFIELVSPLKSTVQGRQAIANQLLEQGMIEKPSQFLDIILHGKLDGFLEGSTSMLEALRTEREKIIANQEVTVHELQNHHEFIKSEIKLANDPKYMNNPQIKQKVYDLILERVRVWKKISEEQSELLIVSGLPNYNDLVAPPPPLDEKGQPLPPPPPTSDLPPQEPQLEGGNTALEQIEETGIPNNPLTGEPPKIAGVN